MDELERIKKVYEKRKIEQKDKVYSYFNKGSLFIIHQREKALLDILNKFNYSDLTNKKILDIGCGTGGTLRRFIDYGAKPENLYGIDLLEDRIEVAKELHPKINFIWGNAENLPYPDEFFDIVMQFTVFTSILDTEMKRKIASEMIRVLKNDGMIIWYDYHINNPQNPDVRGVKRKEIYELFPNYEIVLKHVTLAPPITRKIAPFSFILCSILEKIPFLCTHYLGIIRRKP
jgi:ubiquinone/menaquinone biosynthesis C-methylase UbiE